MNFGVLSEEMAKPCGAKAEQPAIRRRRLRVFRAESKNKKRSAENAKRLAGETRLLYNGLKQLKYAKNRLKTS